MCNVIALTAAQKNVVLAAVLTMQGWSIHMLNNANVAAEAQSNLNALAVITDMLNTSASITQSALTMLADLVENFGEQNKLTLDFFAIVDSYC